MARADRLFAVNDRARQVCNLAGPQHHQWGYTTVAPLSVGIVPTSPWERQFPSLPGYNPIAGVSEPDPNFSGLHQRGTRPESLDTWQAFRDARQAARSILATAHIGRKPNSLSYAVGGNLVKLTGHYPTASVRRMPQADTTEQAIDRAILHMMRNVTPMDDSECGARAAALVPGQLGLRGEVLGFSGRSRSRLMQHMASLPRASLCMPWFVTLTYPAAYSPDPAVWRKNRRAFLMRIYREFGDCAVIWRLEPQQRGAPHFHLMVFTDAALALPQEGTGRLNWSTLSRWWYDIVGSADSWHLIHGVRDVQRVRSWNGVMSYASKYLCKGSDIRLPGRQWGIEQKALLLIRLVHIAMPSAAWYAVRRALFGLVPHREPAWSRDSRGRIKRVLTSARYTPQSPHSGTWRMLPEAVGVQLAMYGVPLTYPPRRLYDTQAGRTHLPHSSGGKARHGRDMGTEHSGGRSTVVV